MTDRLIDRWLGKFPKEERRKFRLIIITAVGTGILSYFYLMIDGYMCPDGLTEGLYYYTNWDWALRNGRWVIEHLLKLFGHYVVIPSLIVIVYSLCIAVAVNILSKLWNIRETCFLILASALLIANPTVIKQLSFAYMALAYSFAFLFSVAFCYLVPKKNWLCVIAGGALLMLSFGLYQTYVAAVLMCILITVILNLLDGGKLLSQIKLVLKYAVVFVIAYVVNTAIYMKEIKDRGLKTASRVSEFSLHNIFKKLRTSVPETYRILFSYFNDAMLKRKYFYLVFFFICVMVMIGLLICLFRKHAYVSVVFAVLGIIALPVAANVIKIFLPDEGIWDPMKYHYVLLIPFGFAILERQGPGKLRALGEYACSLCMFIILVTYVVSANATFLCYRISYHEIQTETQMILTDIYELDGYKPNETRIVFAGFPRDDEVRKHIGTYKYAISLTVNAAYWEDWNGLTNCRYWYLMDYCGIDAGWFSKEEYTDIIRSDTFKDMHVWPAEGSVRMFGDMAVVKLTENPPIVGD